MRQFMSSVDLSPIVFTIRHKFLNSFVKLVSVLHLATYLLQYVLSTFHGFLGF